MNKNINEFLEEVGAKLSTPTATQLMQFGTRSKVRGQAMLRDDGGMLITKSNVLDIAQTFFAATQGRDELQKTFANFAENPAFGGSKPSTGQEAISGVKTVGAIDVTILSLSTSIIPFVAVDRSMPTETATIYYNDLVSASENGTGGVNNGETVNGNFSPPNMKVRLSTEVKDASTTESSGTYTANLGKVVPGSVVVKYIDGDTVIEGRDYAGNGIIFFPAGNVVTAATIDYDGDSASLSVTATAGKTVKVSYQKDTGAKNTEPTGILVVVPKYTPVTLSTTRDDIIVQDNLVNRMAMAKIQLLATAGAGGTSQADVLMARTKNTYIEALNAKVLDALIGGYTHHSITGESDPVVTTLLDLTEYNVGAWATTKNDQVLQLMTNLDAKFLATTGIADTAIITSTYGVALLSCVAGVWTPNPDAVNGLNGLAGYFNGKPVYRHNYVDSMDIKKDGVNAIPFFAVAKLPDNNSGSAVFGEFLPLTSTGVVGNYSNPQNISTGFFSQTGCKVVDANLVKLAAIVPPAGGLFK